MDEILQRFAINLQLTLQSKDGNRERERTEHAHVPMLGPTQEARHFTFIFYSFPLFLVCVLLLSFFPAGSQKCCTCFRQYMKKAQSWLLLCFNFDSSRHTILWNGYSLIDHSWGHDPLCWTVSGECFKSLHFYGYF